MPCGILYGFTKLRLCYTALMAVMTEDQWVEAVRARGLEGAASLALDVLQPLGLLGAQVLWVAQPAARLFGGGDALAALAQALETPEGISRLRSALGDDEI